MLDRGHINVDVLRSCGLERVFDETMTLPETCLHHKCTGPGDIPGMVLCPIPVHRKPPPHGTYHPQSQLWFDRGPFWIGVEKSNEPTPEDLERTKVYRGRFSIRDPYNRSWLVPIIKCPPPGRGSLPVQYGFEKDGSVIERVSPQFDTVWELAGDALDYLQANQTGLASEEIEKRWPEAHLLKLAIEFLTVNYRISIHEASALLLAGKALLDTEFVMNVMMAVSNWPAWVEYSSLHSSDDEKKNTSAVAS